MYHCSIKSCTKPTKKLRRGYCQKHYKHLMLKGDPLYYEKLVACKPKKCIVDGCDSTNLFKGRNGKTHLTKGLCKLHYHRHHRNGTYESKSGRIRELHGMTRTREHQSWSAMIERCRNKNVKGYKNYGGRGIKVCESWSKSFMAFYRDMGERPEGTTLDRIDVNGNYEPSNCRWATYQEQTDNRRVTVRSNTGVYGVHMNEYGKYIAYFSYKGKRYILSISNTLEEAIIKRSAKIAEVVSQ